MLTPRCICQSGATSLYMPALLWEVLQRSPLTLDALILPGTTRNWEGRRLDPQRAITVMQGSRAKITSCHRLLPLRVADIQPYDRERLLTCMLARERIALTESTPAEEPSEMLRVLARVVTVSSESGGKSLLCRLDPPLNRAHAAMSGSTCHSSSCPDNLSACHLAIAHRQHGSGLLPAGLGQNMKTLQQKKPGLFHGHIAAKDSVVRSAKARLERIQPGKTSRALGGLEVGRPATLCGVSKRRGRPGRSEVAA
jgi:hypothetical protein